MMETKSVQQLSNDQAPHEQEQSTAVVATSGERHKTAVVGRDHVYADGSEGPMRVRTTAVGNGSATLKQRWKNSCVPEAEVAVNMPSSAAAAAAALSNNGSSNNNNNRSRSRVLGVSGSKCSSAVASSAIFASSNSSAKNSSSNSTSTNNSGGGSSSSLRMGSRRIFTPQFKLQVLQSYRNDGDCKGNQRATARKYNIHRRQIQKWLQCESNLRSSVANINHTNVKQQFHNVSHHHPHHHHHQHQHQHQHQSQQQQHPSALPNANQLAVAAAYQRHLEQRQHQQQQQHHHHHIHPHTHLLAQEHAFISKIVQRNSEAMSNGLVATPRLAAKIAAAARPSNMSVDLATVMAATAATCGTLSHRTAAAFSPEAAAVASLAHPLYNHHHHHHGYPLMPPPPPCSSASSSALATPVEAPQQLLAHQIIRPYPYGGYPEHLAAAAAAAAVAAQEASRAYGLPPPPPPSGSATTATSAPSSALSGCLPIAIVRRRDTIIAQPCDAPRDNGHEYHQHPTPDGCHDQAIEGGFYSPTVYTPAEEAFADNTRVHSTGPVEQQQQQMPTTANGAAILPMDLSVGPRRDTDQQSGDVGGEEESVAINEAKSGAIMDLTFRKRKIGMANGSANSDEDLSSAGKLVKMSESRENYSDDLNNTVSEANDVASDNLDENLVDVETDNVDDEMPAAVKPVKLFKPYLLDDHADADKEASGQQADNAASEAGNTSCSNGSSSSGGAAVWRIPQPHCVSPHNSSEGRPDSNLSSSFQSAPSSAFTDRQPHTFHNGVGSSANATTTTSHANNELLTSNGSSSSQQSAFSPTTSVPAVSPSARSFRCAKDSPVSGYESSSSTYSDTAAAYKYADIGHINVELQMNSLYRRENRSPQRDNVQKWLDHATYTTPAPPLNKASIMLFAQ